jgi:hypothetical protein
LQELCAAGRRRRRREEEAEEEKEDMRIGQKKQHRNRCLQLRPWAQDVQTKSFCGTEKQFCLKMRFDLQKMKFSDFFCC